MEFKHFMKKEGLVVLGCGVLLLFIVLYFFYHSPGDEEISRAKQVPDKMYSEYIVEEIKAPVWYQAVGLIDSENKAVVSSQASGVVIAFDADLGDFVEKGTPVVQIQAEELAARVARVKSELVGAEKQEQIAQSHFDRTSELYRVQAATREQYEQAEQRLSQAKSQASATREMLRETEVNFAYLEAKAPFSGIVAEKFVEPGDLAWPGRQLYSIYDPSKLRIEVTVPERYVSKLKLGVEALVDVQSAGREIKADIAEIRPSVDPKTRAFVVKADLKSPGNMIFPGMFGTLRFKVGERDEIYIPASAVMTLGQLKLVWVETPQGWQKRYVTVGKEVEGNKIAVLSGLSPKEKVALIGN